ncbi:MAG: metallophosphoesterase family protein [Opitutales bacterium]
MQSQRTPIQDRSAKCLLRPERARWRIAQTIRYSIRLSPSPSKIPNDLIIAVISATHNHLPEALVDRLRPAEEIWHLDDVCRPETLEKLDELPADRFTFQGNNDPYFQSEERLTLERNGLYFQL